MFASLVVAVTLWHCANAQLLVGPAMTGITATGSELDPGCASYANDPVAAFNNALHFLRPNGRSPVPLPVSGAQHWRIARSSDGIAVVRDYPRGAAALPVWIYRTSSSTWDSFDVPWLGAGFDGGLTGASVGAGLGVFLVAGGKGAFLSRPYGLMAIANATNLTDVRVVSASRERGDNPTVCEVGGRWIGSAGGVSSASSCSSSNSQCARTADFYDTVTKTSRSVALTGPARSSSAVACAGDAFFVAGGSVGSLSGSDSDVIDIVMVPSFSVRTASLGSAKRSILGVRPGVGPGPVFFLGGSGLFKGREAESYDATTSELVVDLRALSNFGAVDASSWCAAATTDGSIYLVKMATDVAEFRASGLGATPPSTPPEMSCGTMTFSIIVIEVLAILLAS